MFAEVFKNYLTTVLNDMSADIKDDTGIGYDVSISLNNSFNSNSKNEICCNLVCGGDSKIDGAKESSYFGFNMHIWAEHNTNGKYTKDLFDLFFDKYSMKAVTIIDGTDTYSCFLNFSNAQFLNQEQCEGGYRAKYVMIGTIIFSQTNEVGRHTYIAFVNSSTTVSNVNWLEIDPISPAESVNYNNDPQQVKGGLMLITGITGRSGSLNLVAKKDSVTQILLNSLFGISTSKDIWLKIVYTDYTYIYKGLVIDSIDSSFDDNSRHTVLTISYRKDDLNGIV